ncbi:MAG: hypothetical protein JXA41_01435 [Deltaproteobacteria bacterium]|nr:hypothetical protein [Deltaproteobacteria bacterium]
MKSKLVVSMGITISLLLLAVGQVFGQEKVSPSEWTQIVEQIGDSGRINWSEGYIEAVGIGAPPERAFGKPQARPMALRAATLDAYRKLLEVTKGVRIDASTTVRDFTVESDVINTQVNGLIKGAKEVHKEYLSDGTVEVTIRMPLSGTFSEIFIPRAMIKKPLDQQEPTAPARESEFPEDDTSEPDVTETDVAKPAKPEAAGDDEAAPKAPAKIVYTGMVVDARGLQARPAMSPKILDESGQEIYGSANVDREYAIQQGVSGYARDLTAAQSNPRVTNNPVSLKGIKTEGPGRCDIVISNADAELIRASGDYTDFLKKCRVMIVLD